MRVSWSAGQVLETLAVAAERNFAPADFDAVRFLAFVAAPVPVDGRNDIQEAAELTKTSRHETAVKTANFRKILLIWRQGTQTLD